jgi:hypothetical protein
MVGAEVEVVPVTQPEPLKISKARKRARSLQFVHPT